MFPKEFKIGNKVQITKRLVIKRDTAEGRGIFAPRKQLLSSEPTGDVWAKKGDTLTFYGGFVKIPEAKRADMGPDEGTHYNSVTNGQGLVIDGLGWSFEKQVQCVLVLLCLCACAMVCLSACLCVCVCQSQCQCQCVSI